MGAPIHVASAGLRRQFMPSGVSSKTAPRSNTPLDLVNLTPLMELSRGRGQTMIALIDGPVATGHPDLSEANIRELPGRLPGTCDQTRSFACMHGTFVAGILIARRGSLAPAICPDTTLLVRPIFAETSATNAPMPSATPKELATAIFDCVEAGAHIINLSAALVQPSSKGERRLEEALDYSARRGVIVVAAAGNQGTVGSSVITRHSWVIPVIACNSLGRPLSYSNLGNSIGRRGLSAPGENITSLVANGKQLTFGGTSAAAPFVTGAIALMWSEFPNATAAQVKFSIMRSTVGGSATVVPRLLNAWSAYQAMATTHARGGAL
ncbi:MAG TPA: S8 family serine peptidase [Pyrinomonadaceae bacterium]|nr:S8 family serine peptidase [Pyrinomonadaceae bacterium]